MNPFEPLPGSAEESNLTTLTGTRAIWTLVLGQVLGCTGMTALSLLSCGMCGVGYWVSPFLVSLGWALVMGRRYTGLQPRDAVVPGIVGGLAVAVPCVGAIAALLALGPPDGSTPSQDPTVMYVALAVAMVPVSVIESVVGAVVGLALGPRR